MAPEHVLGGSSPQSMFLEAVQEVQQHCTSNLVTDHDAVAPEYLCLVCAAEAAARAETWCNTAMASMHLVYPRTCMHSAT